MIELIYNQIINEITEKLRRINNPSEQIRFLKEFRHNLKRRMRQLEHEQQRHVQHDESDLDQEADNPRQIREKFSFCRWLIEEYIHDELVRAGKMALAAQSAASGNGTNGRHDEPFSDDHDNDHDSETAGIAVTEEEVPTPEPMRWGSSRKQLVELVRHLARLGTPNQEPSPDDILAVSQLFVDPKGKSFPLEMFVSKPPLRQADTVRISTPATIEVPAPTSLTGHEARRSDTARKPVRSTERMTTEAAIVPPATSKPVPAAGKGAARKKVQGETKQTQRKQVRKSTAASPKPAQKPKPSRKAKPAKKTSAPARTASRPEKNSKKASPAPRKRKNGNRA